MALDIRHFREIGSTNDYALKVVASKTLSSDFAIVANRQTAGRGRLNARVWASPAGNFYCSYGINLQRLRVAETSILTSDVICILQTYLIKITNSDRIALKQPNDILVNGKKLAGVLTEISFPYAVIGVGINLVNSPIERATDLKSEFNLLVKPMELVENFYEFLVSELEKCYPR